MAHRLILLPQLSGPQDDFSTINYFFNERNCCSQCRNIVSFFRFANEHNTGAEQGETTEV